MTMIFSGCARSSRQTEEPRGLGDAIDDATITVSVKMALAFKLGVSAMRIDVDTYRGVVTLKGKVGTEAERQIAFMVTEDVEDVRQVVNRLRVRG